ncbi:hypothetical protein E4U53_006729, partial [Claviceps sorghi]
MIPGDWDIIFPAKVRLTEAADSEAIVEYEVTHLTCFIGGMYALGGKLFGREKDVKYAQKLTDGCVWAYQSTASGIMPEAGRLMPCPTFEKCSFNETLWLERLGFHPRPSRRHEKPLRLKAKEMQRRGEDEASAAKHKPDSPKSAAKRAVVPGVPPGAGLADSRATGRDVDVEAEKAADNGADLFQAKDAQSPETKLELPVLKEDYRPRSVAKKIPKADSQDSQWSENPASDDEFVQEQVKPDLPPGYTEIGWKQYILR